MDAIEIDLMPFCEKDKNCRYPMNEPWVHDGWKYATDARIIVRVPTDEPTSIFEGKGNSPPSAFRLSWPTPDATGWQPWPELRLLVAEGFCRACDGLGGSGECEPCRGAGLVPDGYGETECDSCDGTGKKTECPTCKWSGWEIYPCVQRIDVRLIDYEYDAKIRALPHVEFIPSTDRHAGINFRFDGGQGIMMPLDEKFIKHLEAPQ